MCMCVYAYVYVCVDMFVLLALNITREHSSVLLLALNTTSSIIHETECAEMCNQFIPFHCENAQSCIATDLIMSRQ